MVVRGNNKRTRKERKEKKIFCARSRTVCVRSSGSASSVSFPSRSFCSFLSISFYTRSSACVDGGRQRTAWFFSRVDSFGRFTCWLTFSLFFSSLSLSFFSLSVRFPSTFFYKNNCEWFVVITLSIEERVGVYHQRNFSSHYLFEYG